MFEIKVHVLFYNLKVASKATDHRLSRLAITKYLEYFIKVQNSAFHYSYNSLRIVRIVYTVFLTDKSIIIIQDRPLCLKREQYLHKSDYKGMRITITYKIT